MNLRISRWLSAIVALIAAPAVAHAQSAMDLVSRETVTAIGDIRMVGVDGETSWLDGGYGKTRFDTNSSDRDFRIGPKAVEGDLIWTPRFTWALTAAGRHDVGRHVSVLLEAMHIASDKTAREFVGLTPRQEQTQVQLAVRLRF